jgi:hypothetical protein
MCDSVRSIESLIAEIGAGTAIEDLLVKERLDLPPQLRELDAQVEAVELALRRKIDEDLGGDADRLPPHVRRLMSGF